MSQLRPGAGLEPIRHGGQILRIRAKRSPAAPADPTSPTPSQTFAGSAAAAAAVADAMLSRLAGAFPRRPGPETGVALALWPFVSRSVADSPPCPASCVPPAAGAPGCPSGCAPAGEPAAAGDVLSGAGTLDGVPGLWGVGPCGVVPWGAGLADVVGADDVGAVDVGAVDVGAGEGVAVAVGVGEPEGVGVGWGEALVCPPEPPRTPFSRPLTPKRSPSAATSAEAVGSVLPSAAWDAGTPADRTSTAPTAAAAAPRRSPPWILVREREKSDL
jgi:hypothetical protein